MRFFSEKKRKLSEMDHALKRIKEEKSRAALGDDGDGGEGVFGVPSGNRSRRDRETREMMRRKRRVVGDVPVEVEKEVGDGLKRAWPMMGERGARPGGERDARPRGEKRPTRYKAKHPAEQMEVMRELRQLKGEISSLRQSGRHFMSFGEIDAMKERVAEANDSMNMLIREGAEGSLGEDVDNYWKAIDQGNNKEAFEESMKIIDTFERGWEQWNNIYSTLVLLVQKLEDNYRDVMAVNNIVEDMKEQAKETNKEVAKHFKVHAENFLNEVDLNLSVELEEKAEKVLDEFTEGVVEKMFRVLLKRVEDRQAKFIAEERSKRRAKELREQKKEEEEEEEDVAEDDGDVDEEVKF